MTIHRVRLGLLVGLLVLLLAVPFLVLAQTDVQPGDTIEGQLSSANPTMRYVLVGSAGDQVTLRLTSTDFDVYLTLLDANSVIVAEDDDSAGGTDALIQDFTLPSSGEYTIQVDSYNLTSTGVFTLSIEGSLTPPETPEVTATATAQVVMSGSQIAYGDSITASITVDMPAGVYTFSGSAGDVVTIEMTSASFDAYLELRDAEGNTLIADDDSAGDLNARIANFVLPADGDYTIRAGSFGGGVSGSFQLTLTQEAGTPATPSVQPATTVPVEMGQSLAGDLESPGVPAAFSLEGRSGDIVSITVESLEFDPLVTLQNSSGADIATDDDSAGNLNARIANFQLPDTGTYLILVSSLSRSARGSFVLTVDQGTAAAQPPPTAEPNMALGDDALTPGQSISAVLSPDQPEARFTFAAIADQEVTITASSAVFDPVLTLLDTDGAELAVDDDGAGALNARISKFRVPGDGMYTVVVSAFSPLIAQSPFNLLLELVDGSLTPTEDPGQVTPGTTIEGELTVTQPEASYTFAGRAGDTVTITARSNAFDTFLTLLGPDGDILASDDDSAGNLNSQIANFTLPQDGIYTAVVSSFAPSVDGPFTLLIEGASEVAVGEPTIEPTAEPPAVGGTDLVIGQPVEGTLDDSSDSIEYTFFAEEGQPLTISAESEILDVYISVLDEDGNVLAYDDDSGDYLNALITVFSPPADGVYTLLVQTYTDESSNFEVTLREAEVESLSYGEGVVGTIDPENMTSYVFEGDAGDVIAINLTAPYDSYVSLRYPDGFQLTSSSIYDRSTILGPLELTTSGTYVVVVLNYDAVTNSGEYTLTLDQVETAELDYGDSLDLEFNPEQSVYYVQFDGDVNDIIDVRVNSGDSIDTRLTLVGPDGYVVTSDEDGGAGFDPELNRFILAFDGTYFIILQAVTPGSSGTVSFSLQQREAATLNDGPIEVVLTETVYRSIVTFDGRAGERVRLTIENLSAIESDSPSVMVIQDDLTLYSAYGYYLGSQVIEFVTPYDGEVTLEISHNGYGLTNVRLNLERLQE